MLRSVKALQKCSVRAADGEVGNVRDFYFDDEMWTIRYLVVDGAALARRRNVLISPMSIARVDFSERALSLSVSCRQVADSPDVDLHKPVSRQHEADFLGYYGYPYYWAGPGPWGVGASPLALATPQPFSYDRDEATSRHTARDASESSEDRHLRSTWEVIHYHVRANDGDLGHVEDFLVDDESWRIHHAVIDTSNWWFGKQVLVSPDWITSIDWAGSSVVIDRSRDSLKSAGAYDPDALIEEQRRADYHQHP